jgi:hypothetical protein
MPASSPIANGFDLRPKRRDQCGVHRHRLRPPPDMLEVSHVPLQSPPRQLLAHDHFPTRIHSNEVKATLAENPFRCSDTVIVSNDVSLGALLSRISCASAAAIHWVGARPVHTIIWPSGCTACFRDPCCAPDRPSSCRPRGRAKPQ